MKWRDEWTAYILMLPAIIYVLYLAFIPAIEAVYGSFHTATGKTSLYNYNFVFSTFGTSPIINTFIVTASALLLQFTVAFLVASLLSKPFRGRGVFSAIFLIPFGVATIVTGVIFHDIFSTFGGYANTVLLDLHLKPIDWTGSYGTSLLVLILADSWKNTPIVTLVLLSGMVTIPSDLYAQAMVDGAGPISRFFHITIPNMIGFIAIALMIRGISEFNIFAMALLLFPHALLTTMTYALFDTVNAYPADAGATILLAFVLVFAALVMFMRSRQGKVSSNGK
ncbi:trehalose/maltose transporter, inner membrane protein MalF related protein [Thermoplasma acidophilum]|uniref:Trehalose/maltose transporter, inner membrane protein MalF related protein n=1 Tax=Thermoplasma acidophilum (strain ATCC 25905 / DSM 1728 / JCM 9062 / NBRC 15155 / AMRC-C165) TaxID=273075 RepID=Q9HLT0_THEAC|nr:trehalose/maltose transporter, inner membrane protein MalF related protein [Thermoplasma acidophilum]